MSVKDLQAAFEEAKRQTRETENKIKVVLPEKRAEALAALDARALLRLGDAGAELKQELHRNKIVEQRRLLELLAAQRQENEKKRKALEAQTKPLAEQIKELQRQIAPLNGEITGLYDLDRQLSGRERDAKRKMEDLLIELQTDIAKLDAPVVRSIPHMAR